MQNNHPVSALMIVTLVIVVIVVAALLIRHLRKPGNLHPMEGEAERNVEQMRQDGPRDRPPL